MQRLRAHRELAAGLLAAAVGLASVVALGLWGWPGHHLDCAATPCYCELPRPGLVRQLGNTWSNLGPVLFGVLMGAWAGHLRRGRERSGQTSEGLDVLGLLFPPVLVFQGVGSMYFHGGLTVWGAALDAMSMFATAGLLVATNLHRLGWVRASNLAWLWSGLMATGLAVGFLGADPVNALMFGLFLTILGTEVLLHRRRLTPTSSFFRAGITLHVAGVSVWALSAAEGLPLCNPVTVWQGHALWHLTAASAVSLFAVHAFRNLALQPPPAARSVEPSAPLGEPLRR